MSHTWPEYRELRNILENASTIMCEKDMITRSCLPDEFGKTQAKGRAIVEHPISLARLWMLGGAS